MTQIDLCDLVIEEEDSQLPATPEERIAQIDKVLAMATEKRVPQLQIVRQIQADPEFHDSLDEESQYAVIVVARGYAFTGSREGVPMTIREHVRDVLIPKWRERQAEKAAEEGAQ